MVELGAFMSVLALGELIYLLVDEDTLTFYPLDETGARISDVGEKAGPGAGVYAGLVSASAAIVGTALLRLMRTKRVLARQAAVARPAPTPSPHVAPTDRLEWLERLASLRESGALSDAEFEAEKAEILGDDHGR